MATQKPAWMVIAPEAAEAYEEIVSDPRWTNGTIPETKKAALMRKFARVILAPELPGRGKDAAIQDFLSSTGVAQRGSQKASYSRGFDTGREGVNNYAVPATGDWLDKTKQVLGIAAGVIDRHLLSGPLQNEIRRFKETFAGLPLEDVARRHPPGTGLTGLATGGIITSRAARVVAPSAARGAAGTAARKAPQPPPPQPRRPLALPPAPAEARMRAQGMTPGEIRAAFAAGDRRVPPPPPRPAHHSAGGLPAPPLALPAAGQIPIRMPAADPLSMVPPETLQALRAAGHSDAAIRAQLGPADLRAVPPDTLATLRNAGLSDAAILDYIRSTGIGRPAAVKPRSPDALTGQFPRPAGPPGETPLVVQALRDMQPSRQAPPPQLPAPPIAGLLPEQVALPQPPVGGVPGAPRQPVGPDAFTGQIPRREFNSTVPELISRALGGQPEPEASKLFGRGNPRSNKTPVMEALEGLQRRRPDRHWMAVDAGGGSARIVDLGPREVFPDDPIAQAVADWAGLEDIAVHQQRTTGRVEPTLAARVREAESRYNYLSRQQEAGQPRPTSGEAAPAPTAEIQATVPAAPPEPPPGIRALLMKQRWTREERAAFEEWAATPEGRAHLGRPQEQAQVQQGQTTLSGGGDQPPGGPPRKPPTGGGSGEPLGPRDTHPDIPSLIHQARQAPALASRFRATIGRATPEDIEAWKEQGFDVGEGRRVFDGSAFYHVERRHTDPKIEASRGQEPIADADYARIPEVLSKPDQPPHFDVDEAGHLVRVYSKRFNGDLIVVEEARTKHGELAVQSIRKKKAGSAPEGLGPNVQNVGSSPRLMPHRTEGLSPTDPGSPTLPPPESRNQSPFSGSSGGQNAAGRAFSDSLAEGAAESRQWFRDNAPHGIGELLMDEGGSFNYEALFHAARVGAERLANGARQFYDWAKLMLEEFGPPIGRFLKPLWEAARRIEAIPRAAFERAFSGLTPHGQAAGRAYRNFRHNWKTGNETADAILEYWRINWITRYKLDPAYTALKNQGAILERGVRGRGDEIRKDLEATYGKDAPEQEAIYEALTDRRMTDTQFAETTEPIRAEIDEISQTLERVGALAKAGREEYAGQYVKRLYSKYLAGQPALERLFMRGVKGWMQQSRHRGKVVTLTKDQVETFNRPWEVAETLENGKVVITDGETTKTIAAKNLPNFVSERLNPDGSPREAHWTILRNLPEGKVKAWRDWARSERDRFGEYRHAGASLQATFHGWARDLRNGIHLEAISQNPRWSVPAADIATNPELGTVEVMLPPGATPGVHRPEKVLVRPDGSVWRWLPPEPTGHQGLPRWGKLADHFVDPAIYRDLVQARRLADEMRFIRDTTRLWARFKTSWNQNSWVNNFMGGLAINEFAGGNSFDLPAAFQIIREKGDTFERLQRAGLYNDSFARSELIQEAPPGDGSFAGVVTSILGAALKTVKDTHEVLAKGYSAIDDLTRTTLAVTKMREGMTPEEAAAFARDNMPSFDTDAPAMHNPLLKHLYPFAIYPYWMAGRGVEVLLENPAHFARIVTYILGYTAIVNGMRQMQGESPEKQKARHELLPTHLKGPFPGLDYGLTLPHNDTKGQTLVISTRNWNPLGPFDAYENGAVGPVQVPFTGMRLGLPAALIPGGPSMPLIDLVRSNFDPFYQREIVNKSLPATEQARQALGYLADQWLPSGPYHNAQKLVSAFQGRPDFAGRRYDITTALVNQIGLKVQPFDEREAFERMVSRYERELVDIEAPMKSAAARFANGQIDRAEYDRIIAQQRELYLAKMADLERRVQATRAAAR